MVIQSPCIRTCNLIDDICQGCFRSLEEIRAWNSTPNEERKKVMENTFYRQRQITENKLEK